MSIPKIPLADAQQMTANWRALNSAQQVPEINAFKLNREAIDTLLSDPQVETIRTYLVVEEGQVNVILVGVDANGDDVYTDGIYNFSTLCPPACAPNSQLL